MKQIQIADRTLCREDISLGFKERIEIARQLDRLGVDAIELPEIANPRADALLIRTLSSFVKNSVLSVAAGRGVGSVENAAAALSGAAHPRIRIELPLSPVGMEYTCHKKPDKMLLWIRETVSAAREKCADVEFCAVDATRAEPDYLREAIRTAKEAGATGITVCDSAAVLLPDDFSALVSSLDTLSPAGISVSCSNRNGMACASAILAVRAGAVGVKTAVGGDITPVETLADWIRNCGMNYAVSAAVRHTELHRISTQIRWILNGTGNGGISASVPEAEKREPEIFLDAKDDLKTVAAAVAKLGYDLSEEDRAHVYEEFLRVAAKKSVGAKDLDAIVASTALQVPATYRLVSYVINSGNIISASAQVTVEKAGKQTSGISIGDGPVDAAFRALEQITGRHYELDDFQIQSVTEGKEAMGSALVRLRSDGKLYSGNGISTDILGAAIRAYLCAVNKIAYEEEQE